MLKAREEAGEYFGLGSIKYFSGIFWLLCVVYLLLSNCYHQFTNIMSDVLINRYKYTFDQANELTIIPEIVFIAVAPFLSRWVEVKGSKPLFLLFAGVLNLLAYVWMYTLPVDNSYYLYVTFGILGMAFSVIACALFSSVALAVPKAGVGMAFSLLTAVENLGMTVLPLYFGKISEDRTVEAYDECLMSLVALSTAAIVFSAALYLYDTKTTKLLTLPENSKRVKILRRNIDSEYIERSVMDSFVAHKSGYLKNGSFSKTNNSRRAYSFAV